jgi:hypothetical protein
MTAEEGWLAEVQARTAHWRRWGPYLSERQWGTVREDCSPGGTAWDSYPHDHARSRVYRGGEDGLLGISDNHQRPCLALALWNEKDPIPKERLFGLTGSPLLTCVFKTIGLLASIGRRTGVARILGVDFSGFAAWWLWRTIYLSKLPRFERKVRVALDWPLDVVFPKDIVQVRTPRASTASRVAHEPRSPAAAGSRG